MLDNEFVDKLRKENISGMEASCITDMKKVLGKQTYGDVIFVDSLTEILVDLGIKDRLP